jgi:hypothetical protein
MINQINNPSLIEEEKEDSIKVPENDEAFYFEE